MHKFSTKLYKRCITNEEDSTVQVPTEGCFAFIVHFLFNVLQANFTKIHKRVAGPYMKKKLFRGGLTPSKLNTSTISYECSDTKLVVDHS